MTTISDGNVALLQAMMNLTKFHREHEEFYASSPREFAAPCNATPAPSRHSPTSGPLPRRRRARR